MPTDRRRFGLAACLWLAGALPAAAQEPGPPMSAINWLSDSVTAPATAPLDPVGAPDDPPVDTPALVAMPAGDDAAVTPGVTLEAVEVAPLAEGTRPDAIGLLPSAVTGLPRDLWGASRAADLARRIRAEEPDMLPALRALLMRILLAELDPPDPGNTDGAALFLARVDKLLDMGALDQADALLTRAGTDHPEIVRRWFDVALLLGEEAAPCETLAAAPELSPSYQARIFCLARAGDWSGATLLMGTGTALGMISEADADLFARFLDPDLFEGEPPLPRPRTPTPLTFRMFKAIGEAIPTRTLPLAFAHSDLRPNIGWKARLEAAERLARTGAVSDNQLHGLYTERRAAASGGVWTRVRAMHALEAALKAGDRVQTEAALPPLWQALSRAETEVPVARVLGPQLAAMALSGEAGRIAFRMGLLSDAYEQVARETPTVTADDQVLAGIARGQIEGLTGHDIRTRAVIEGFRATQPPIRLASLLATDRLGEAILRAMVLLSEGTAGDLDQVTDALALFRAVGLEDTARRAALEFLILDRRG